MVSGPHVRTVALAFVVVLSGCTFGVGADGLAPTAPGSDARTGGSMGVPLADHSLSLAANSTFERVEGLVGEDVEYPPVRVIEAGTGGGGGGGAIGGFAYTPYRFAEYLDLRNVSADGGPSAAGLTDGFGRVFIVPGSGPEPVLKQVLVHEFVHVVQIRSGMLPAGWPQGGNDTTDAAQVRLALIEGAAVYVTDEYTSQYLDGENVTRQSAQMDRFYEGSRVGGRFVLARYHFGSNYAASELDSPDELRSLYENPPETTEQLLHPENDPAVIYQPLSVAASGGEWDVADPGDVDIMGELFVRVVLSRSLSLSDAASAAAGWGNDRVVEYERGDEAAFAWVLRWDDAANATEFREAMDTYLDRRSTGPDLDIRTTMVGDETVVVFLGPPAFTEEATASGTSDAVQVGVG
jgi:hypothetical protein